MTPADRIEELTEQNRRLVRQNIELQQENERLKRNQKHAYKVLRDGL